MMTEPQDKKALRQKLLALRLAIPEEKKILLDGKLREGIADHPFFGMCDVLLLYAPTKGEPNLLPLTDLAWSLGKQVALPVCHPKDHTLSFHLVSSTDELAMGNYGILEPSRLAPQPELTENTLCLLPALSFDLLGYRLGYGGGYYDRFLENFPGRTIGPIYSCLLTDRLPIGEHDQATHHIMTERGILLSNEA